MDVEQESQIDNFDDAKRGVIWLIQELQSLDRFDSIVVLSDAGMLDKVSVLLAAMYLWPSSCVKYEKDEKVASVLISGEALAAECPS